MVFDDAFAYSDPDRVQTLQRMLDLAAARGLQVIVLTCTPSDYSALGAQTISLRAPRAPVAQVAGPLPEATDETETDAADAAQPAAASTPAAPPPTQPPVNLVTQLSDQAGDSPAKTKVILDFCQAARSVPAIMEKVGIRHRSYFKKNYLDPLLDAGLLTPTHPGQPRHPDQGYLTTEAGRAKLTELSH